MDPKRWKGEESDTMSVSEIWTDEVHVRKRIQWNVERESQLIKLHNQSRPNESGYMSRLLVLWNNENPELQTTETALRQRMYVLRTRMDEMVASWESEPGQGEPEYEARIEVSNCG